MMRITWLCAGTPAYMAPELLCGTAKYLSYPRAIDIFRCLYLVEAMQEPGGFLGIFGALYLFHSLSYYMMLKAHVQQPTMPGADKVSAIGQLWRAAA